MHATCLMVMNVIRDPDIPSILMIRKARPDWQAGKLNLPGGHVEEGESLRDAVERETFEETGISMDSSPPSLCLVMVCRFGNVYVYHSLAHLGRVVKNQPHRDEPLEMVRLADLSGRGDVMNNLAWVVPLVLDNALAFPIYVHYNLNAPGNLGHAQ